MTDLNIETTTRDGWCVVRVEGEVDLASAPRLERALQDAAPSAGNGIVTDLTSVGFMDSTGLRVMVGGASLFDDDRSFRLVVSEGPVSKLLDITGLARRLEVFDTVDAATSTADGE